MANKKLLEDPEWLFTVLTSLVKKEGGELRLSDKELLSVSKKDIVGLFYDKKSSCTILKLITPTELMAGHMAPSSDDDLDN